jgi:hypothetical protein
MFGVNVFSIIGMYLDGYDAAQCRLVCHIWKHYVDSSEISTAPSIDSEEFYSPFKIRSTKRFDPKERIHGDKIHTAKFSFSPPKKFYKTIPYNINKNKVQWY